MKQLLFKLSPLIDLAILPAVCLFSPFMLVFRKFNAKRLPVSSKLFQFFGVWSIRQKTVVPWLRIVAVAACAVVWRAERRSGP